MDNSLFIGLVTHPMSRFPEAAGPDGLLAQLESEMRQRGWRVEVVQETENRANHSAMELTAEAVRSSIDLELQTEYEWGLFQQSTLANPVLKAKLRVLDAWRKWRFSGTQSKVRSRGRPMLVRLANIEHAHLSLMEAAVATNAQWVLILEDDAQSENVAALADDLTRHLSDWTNECQPQYVNISRSFAVSDLGIGGEPTKVSSWNEQSSVLSAPIPYTNTVCAVLYRREFLKALHQQLRSIPLEPVIPIDWKLNRAIMALSRSGKLGAGDCYSIEPAPIVQGSMHDQQH